MGEHLLNMSQYDSRFSLRSQKEERNSQTTLCGKVLPASLTIRKNSCTLNTSSEEIVTWSSNQNALDLRPTELFSATDCSLGFKPLLCVSPHPTASPCLGPCCCPCQFHQCGSVRHFEGGRERHVPITFITHRCLFYYWLLISYVPNT